MGSVAIFLGSFTQFTQFTQFSEVLRKSGGYNFCLRTQLQVSVGGGGGGKRVMQL